MSSRNSVNESGVQYSNRSTTSKSVMSSRDLISSPTRNSSADDPPAAKKRVEPSKSSLPNTSRQISSTVWPRSGCGDVGKIEVGVRLEILSQSVPTSGQGLLRRRGQQHRRGPNLWCSSGVRRASQHRVGVGAAHAERTDGAVLDRCTGEQKLETISLRQDPSFVASILRNYVDDPDIDPARFEQAQRDRQVAFERDALSSLAPKDRKRLVGIMQKARAAVRARESMRLIRTRIVGVGRAIYCEAGRLLAAAGELADKRDVFYLTMEGLRSFAEGRSTAADLDALARTRRRVRALRRRRATQSVRDVRPAVLEDHPLHLADTRRAAGRSSAARHRMLAGNRRGRHPGRPQPHRRPQCQRQDSDHHAHRSRWGPLFPSVKGLLIERGSTQSHSAVLSRELGIPAVVGVPGLMATIRSGERVRLDGGAGVVERLDG